MNKKQLECDHRGFIVSSGNCADCHAHYSDIIRDQQTEIEALSNSFDWCNNQMIEQTAALEAFKLVTWQCYCHELEDYGKKEKCLVCSTFKKYRHLIPSCLEKDKTVKND